MEAGCISGVDDKPSDEAPSVSDDHDGQIMVTVYLMSGNVKGVFQLRKTDPVSVLMEKLKTSPEPYQEPYHLFLGDKHIDERPCITLAEAGIIDDNSEVSALTKDKSEELKELSKLFITPNSILRSFYCDKFDYSDDDICCQVPIYIVKCPFVRALCDLKKISQDLAYLTPDCYIGNPKGTTAFNPGTRTQMYAHLVTGVDRRTGIIDNWRVLINFSNFNNNDASTHNDTKIIVRDLGLLLGEELLTSNFPPESCHLRQWENTKRGDSQEDSQGVIARTLRTMFPRQELPKRRLVIKENYYTEKMTMREVLIREAKFSSVRTIMFRYDIGPYNHSRRFVRLSFIIEIFGKTTHSPYSWGRASFRVGWSEDGEFVGSSGTVEIEEVEEACRLKDKWYYFDGECFGRREDVYSDSGEILSGGEFKQVMKGGHWIG